MHGRKLGDTVHEFGHEGVLYRESFIMYDKATASLWVHTTGECVKGPLKGSVLPFLPATTTTWKRWKELHPDTVVLTGRRADDFMGRFGLADTPRAYGLSLGQGPEPKLYPVPALAEARVVEDTWSGRPVVLYWDAASHTGRAWRRGARTFRWKDGRAVDGQGRPWDLLRGLREGAGDRLRPLPLTPWLTARWRDFHPRGPVWAPPSED